LEALGRGNRTDRGTVEVSATIEAIVVNQNTSMFVELALRSLFDTNDLAGIEFGVTVLDNGSTEEDVTGLKGYLKTRDIAFVQTGLDAKIAPEKHTVALTEFVKRATGCGHYLFLDCDMWFTEADTIPTMLRELLEAGEHVFANQARVWGHYAKRVIEGRDGVPGASDLDGQTWEIEFDKTRYAASGAPRCSPVCSLVGNSPTFRRVVEAVGLHRAVAFQSGTATYYDTFALMTQIMATHGFRFMVSSKTVNHFTNTVWCPQWREIRDKECMDMLVELRKKERE